MMSKRGVSFNIPGEEVDGMDVIAVRKAAAKAVARARDGEGPYILEMKTYRYRGHSMSDPAKYRSKEEVQKMREERDPIEQVRRRLLEDWKVSEDELKAIDGKLQPDPDAKLEEPLIVRPTSDCGANGFQ